MPAVSQQNEDLSNTHSLRCETFIPRASIHEHCNKALHEALGHKCPVSEFVLYHEVAAMRKATRLQEFDITSSIYPLRFLLEEGLLGAAKDALAC